MRFLPLTFLLVLFTALATVAAPLPAGGSKQPQNTGKLVREINSLLSPAIGKANEFARTINEKNAVRNMGTAITKGLDDIRGDTTLSEADKVTKLDRILQEVQGLKKICSSRISAPLQKVVNLVKSETKKPGPNKKA